MPPNLEGGISGDWAAAVGWAISYAYLGRSAWRQSASNTWSSGGVDAVEEWITGYAIPRARNASVPDSFEMFHIKTTAGTQDFTLWRMTPTGKIKLKKVSNNTSITG